MTELARSRGAVTLSLSALAAAFTAIAACSTGEVSIPGPKDLPPDTPPSSSGGTATGVGPTFHKDVEPILQARCQKCHTTDGLAPFELLTYEDAKIRSAAMVAETKERRMPPWGALDTTECKPRLPWNHDERLGDAEIKMLADWDAAGKPEGDPKDAPPARAIPALDLPNPTDTLAPKAPFTTSGDSDQFRCFVLEHRYAQGAYVTGIQVLPGNAKVVHHAVVFTDPGGRFAAKAGPDGSFDCSSSAMTNDGDGQTDGQSSTTLHVWAPGITPVDLPSNIAIPLVPNSKLIMQIHYSPGGTKAAPDLTKVQLRTTLKKPEGGVGARASSARGSLLSDVRTYRGRSPRGAPRTTTPRSTRRSSAWRRSAGTPRAAAGVVRPAGSSLLRRGRKRPAPLRRFAIVTRGIER